MGQSLLSNYLSAHPSSLLRDGTRPPWCQGAGWKMQVLRRGLAHRPCDAESVDPIADLVSRWVECTVRMCRTRRWFMSWAGCRGKMNHITQNSMQCKSYELFVPGIFPFNVCRPPLTMGAWNHGLGGTAGQGPGSSEHQCVQTGVCEQTDPAHLGRNGPPLSGGQ